MPGRVGIPGCVESAPLDAGFEFRRWSDATEGDVSQHASFGDRQMKRAGRGFSGGQVFGLHEAMVASVQASRYPISGTQLGKSGEPGEQLTTQRASDHNLPTGSFPVHEQDQTEAGQESIGEMVDRTGPDRRIEGGRKNAHDRGIDPGESTAELMAP